MVSPANINAPGQVVIAGQRGAVKRASERAKEARAGPWRCRSARRSTARLMRPAEDRLAPRLRALPARDPKVPVVANVDAAAEARRADGIEALVRQVSAPVLWQALSSACWPTACGRSSKWALAAC